MSKMTDEQSSIMLQHNYQIAAMLGHDSHITIRETKIDDSKTILDILAAQWIDGQPKDAGKGRFVLVMKSELGGRVHEMIWNASQDSLAMLIDFNGPVIKHMRLPDYE